MANEAIIIELLGNQGDPISYTCAEDATIEKGTVLELTDPRTCVKASGAGVVIAGIAAAEKVAGDGSTTIAVYTNGIFSLATKAGGTAVLGSYVRAAANDNTIDAMTTLDYETGKAIGKSLETSGASTRTAIRVLL
ncbi:hypothetical protein KAR91_46825 [Candidatus Pacearchaeota archaeon]|nr:hypothetical protein [Candidatus Pacearchaeota archaeon]